MKNYKHKYLIVFVILVFVLGIFSVSVLFNTKSKAFTPQKLLLEINKDTFNQKIISKDNFYIYIGRPTCPNCKVFLPKLQDTLKSVNKQILYYNTEAPASKKQAIRDFLSKFGVKSIPSIILFKQGKVCYIYDCNNINEFNKFSNYFKEGKE